MIDRLVVGLRTFSDVVPATGKRIPADSAEAEFAGLGKIFEAVLA